MANMMDNIAGYPLVSMDNRFLCDYPIIKADYDMLLRCKWRWNIDFEIVTKFIHNQLISMTMNCTKPLNSKIHICTIVAEIAWFR